jgi:hypothetical protein
VLCTDSVAVRWRHYAAIYRLPAKANPAAGKPLNYYLVPPGGEV